MNIQEAATNWAKTEAVYSMFFTFFGVMFLVISLGFWFLGKTDIAKAYIYPTLIVGSLLVLVGLGLFYSNYSRLSDFSNEFNKNSEAFVQSEINRVDKTLIGFKRTVFKIIPLIIIFCSIVIIMLDKPIYRAPVISVIAMMIIIILIDSNAIARLENYKKLLINKEETSTNK